MKIFEISRRNFGTVKWCRFISLGCFCFRSRLLSGKLNDSVAFIKEVKIIESK